MISSTHIHTFYHSSLYNKTRYCNWKTWLCVRLLGYDYMHVIVEHKIIYAELVGLIVLLYCHI